MAARFGLSPKRPCLPSNADAAERKDLKPVFERPRQRAWSVLSAEIDAALISVKASGFCSARGSPRSSIAVAAPPVIATMAHAVNVSVLTTNPVDAVARRLAPKRLTFRADNRIVIERTTDAVMP